MRFQIRVLALEKLVFPVMRLRVALRFRICWLAKYLNLVEILVVDVV